MRRTVVRADDSCELIVHRYDPQPTDERPQPSTYVLVHGLGVSSLYFIPLAERLAEHARVLVLDLPGFGSSPRPDRRMDIAGLARSLGQSLDELGVDQAVLVGHSMGCQIVAEALATEPGRHRAGVLIAPVVAPHLRTIPRILGKFARSSVHEELKAAWRSVVAYFQCSPVWFFQLMCAMRDYPLEDWISLVTDDLLVIDAPLDRLATGAFARQLVEASGGRSELAVVPGASHQVVTSHADDVAALISTFIERT